MQKSSRRVLAALAASTLALALAGCASSGGTDDGRLRVVASTNVYGQIASEVGGRDVTVTSIIARASQDPHSFEPSARDQLSVERADLIIENGAGYDTFMNQLIQTRAAKTPVITAAELSPSWSGQLDGFNEHVWYDLDTMATVANTIADKLAALDPTHATTYQANAAAFGAGIQERTATLAGIAAAHPDSTVFVTEPVPLYLTEAAGLRNVTPEEFSHAVEEGQDVPPATLLTALELLRDGAVDVLIANSQTGGAETTAVMATAREQGVPVLEFSETLPDAKTYLEWMSQNIAQLESSLR